MKKTVTIAFALSIAVSNLAYAADGGNDTLEGSRLSPSTGGNDIIKGDSKAPPKGNDSLVGGSDK